MIDNPTRPSRKQEGITKPRKNEITKQKQALAWALLWFRSFVVSWDFGPGNEVGFDISGATGVAFASFDDFNFPPSLYTINLANGVATRIGTIGGGNIIVRDISVQPAGVVVPEPGSWALLGLGAAGLLGYAWRRRK